MRGHLEKISSRLAEADLDALFVTGRANLLYCFGFDADEGDGAGIISPKGNWYFTDSRYYQDACRIIKDAEIIEIPKYSSYLRRIGSILHANQLERIGYEETMSVDDAAACERYFYGDMIPAAKLLNEARMCKDPEEIARLEIAHGIADLAFWETLNAVRPGMTEREIATQLQCNLLLKGADELAFPALVQSGPNSCHPHLRPTDRKICEGDLVTIDFGCIKDHYCSDTCRTIAVKRATEENLAAYAAVLEAQTAGMQEAKPGSMLVAADLASRKVLKDHGFDGEYDHAFGHGIGLEAHEPPVSGIGIRGNFSEGFVMTAEPGLYLEDFSVRIEDTFVVSDGCARLLSKVNRTLIIV